MLLRAMDKCGCNGMCYAASALLSRTGRGCQGISLACTEEWPPASTPAKADRAASGLFPCNQTSGIKVASFIFPSSWHEKVKRLLSALEKLKTFIHDFSLASA